MDERKLSHRPINTFIVANANNFLDDFDGNTGTFYTGDTYLTFDIKWNNSDQCYKLYHRGYKNIGVVLQNGYPVHYENWVSFFLFYILHLLSDLNEISLINYLFF